MNTEPNDPIVPGAIRVSDTFYQSPGVAEGLLTPRDLFLWHIFTTPHKAKSKNLVSRMKQKPYVPKHDDIYIWKLKLGRRKRAARGFLHRQAFAKVDSFLKTQKPL